MKYFILFPVLAVITILIIAVCLYFNLPWIYIFPIVLMSGALLGLITGYYGWYF